MHLLLEISPKRQRGWGINPLPSPFPLPFSVPPHTQALPVSVPSWEPGKQPARVSPCLPPAPQYRSEQGQGEEWLLGQTGLGLLEFYDLCYSVSILTLMPIFQNLILRLNTRCCSPYKGIPSLCPQQGRVWLITHCIHLKSRISSVLHGHVSDVTPHSW